MTKTLPDEILFKVFKNFGFNDLWNCQHVCRSWYSPAHIKLLKEVKLTSGLAIQRFIASFDDNPNNFYFNAVKIIRIFDSNGMVPEKETLEKMFFRFPNLEHVEVDDFRLIANFDEELCKEFLLRCSKLKRFDVVADDQDPQLCNSLVNVRPLLTNMYLPGEKYQPNLGDPAQYLTQFPRLKVVHCDDDAVESFKSFLPILEQLPNVSSLALGIQTDDEENFGERYLATKPREVQDQIVERLANITDLFIFPYNDIGNSLKFVSEYFTGLQHFQMERDLSHWGACAAQDLFLVNLFGLLPSVKASFEILLDSIEYTSLGSNFSSLVQNMYQSESPGPRILELNVRPCYNPEQILDITLRSTYLSRKLNIEIQEDFNLDLVLEMFDGAASMDNIDEFVLCFATKDSREDVIDTATYLGLLEPMSSLKKVTFDLPLAYMHMKHQSNQHYDGPVLFKVEEVTFKTEVASGFLQYLSNCCSFAFPNLKRLNIYNFSGTWIPFISEYQLYLQEYSLEKLVLDTTPVVKRMGQVENGFFVVETESRNNGKRHLCKVSLDDFSCQTVDFDDLNDFVCGRDYPRVRIIVNSLQYLELKNSRYSDTQSCVVLLDESNLVNQ